jgi:hypothetical protein
MEEACIVESTRSALSWLWGVTRWCTACQPLWRTLGLPCPSP